MGALQKKSGWKIQHKNHEGTLPQVWAGEAQTFCCTLGQSAAGFPCQGALDLHDHLLILSSKHISDNKKGQDGNGSNNKGQPQEDNSPQTLQHPGPVLNGHYPPQGRGGNLPPPSIAVTRPPGPRRPGMPGYPPGNPCLPGMQPGMPRGPPMYR